MNKQKFIRTYDGLGSATVLLAVILEIIESLGTRHYARDRRVSEKRRSNVLTITSV